MCLRHEACSSRPRSAPVGSPGSAAWVAHWATHWGWRSLVPDRVIGPACRLTSGRDQLGVRAGQCTRQLPPGTDAELGEHVAQMPLNGPRAEEEPRGDLRIGQPIAGEPCDLLLLGGQVVAGLDRPLTYLLARGLKFPARFRSFRRSDDPLSCLDVVTGGGFAAAALRGGGSCRWGPWAARARTRSGAGIYTPPGVAGRTRAVPPASRPPRA